MGRSQNEIHSTTPQRDAFVLDLRALMEPTGMTFERLAERCNRSASTLSVAVNGVKLPPWATVAEFVRGCGGDLEYWKRRYRQVAGSEVPVAPVSLDAYRSTGTVTAAPTGSLLVRKLPPPPADATSEQFVEWMNKVKLRTRGTMSVRRFAKLAAMKPTTLHNLLNRRTLPSWEQVEAILCACLITDPADLGICHEAWLAIAEGQMMDRRRARQRPRGEADPRDTRAG
jgi:transcriptional regulator with XRE-family HTH domain